MRSQKLMNIFLSTLLCGGVFIAPSNVHNIQAEETKDSTKNAYSTNKDTTINKGVGAIDATADLATYKNLDNFTYQGTIQSDGTDVQSLFFLGDSTKETSYITLYLKGRVLGVESKNNNVNFGLNTSFEPSGVNIADGKPHKVTFISDAINKRYTFYVDGVKVKSEALNDGYKFTSGLSSSDFMGLGNGKRSGGRNSYPFNGVMRNIELYPSAISEAEVLKYHNGELVLENENITAPTSITDAGQITSLKAMSEGTVSIRYKSKAASDKVMALFSVSDSSEEKKYWTLYIDPSTNKIGIENREDANGNLSVIGNDTTFSIKDTQWHTITITKKGDVYNVYVDGHNALQFTGKTGFLNSITTMNSIGIGRVDRKNGQNGMPFTGTIDKAVVYNVPMESASVQALQAATAQRTMVKDSGMKTDPISLYKPGYEGSAAYRIPSLLTTAKGTVIAGIDQRLDTSSDWGNIDSVIRRKEIGKTEFDKPVKVVDLIDQPTGSTKDAFLIDPSMVQDSDGTIYMLLDMFPESVGLQSIKETGTGYKSVDGKDYLIIKNTAGKEYTVREDGDVYDDMNNKTDYQVTTKAEAPYRALGNLYKSGDYVGNIYLTSDNGPLHVTNTSYLWLTSSKDDGKTWSQPVDLTPQVKKDWMVFLGTGPGKGLKLENGNLVFPVYHTNKNIGGSQASAVISSSDHGATWTLGESPIKLLGSDPETMTGGSMLTESQAVQLNNGDVKLFMRNTGAGKVRVATSHDGGLTWAKIETINEIPEVYCQLSVLHYNKDGVEKVMLLNPSGPGRKNGKVYLGVVQEGGAIRWDHSKLLQNGDFAYSDIVQLPNGSFAAIYEGADGKVQYTEFDEEWVIGTPTNVALSEPSFVSQETILTKDNKVQTKLTFDQKIMASGSPKLTLSFLNIDYEASYVSGSGTNTLVFETKQALPNSVGVIKLKNVNTSTGTIENISNGVPKIAAMDILETSNITPSNTTASSQYSTSTAENTDGAAVNATDGNPNTYWHSMYGNANIKLPQTLTLQLSDTNAKSIYKAVYLPRQNSNSGRVRDYVIQVSTTDNADGSFKDVISGTFVDSKEEQVIEFIPVSAKYVRLKVLSSYGGTGVENCSVAEFSVNEFVESSMTQGDKTALETAIEEAKAKLSGNYSEATKAQLQKQIEFATLYMNSNQVSQGALDNIVALLNTASKELVSISSLQTQLAIAMSMNENYTTETRLVLDKAIADATKATQEATSQKTIDDMIMKLKFAMNQVVVRGDKTALQQAMQSANDKVEKNYTSSSWQKLQAIKVEASVVINNVDALDPEVAEVSVKLQAALDELVSIQALNLLVEQTYVKSDYEEASWNTYSQALQKAKDAIVAGVATTQEVEALEVELAQAIKDLKPLGLVEELKKVLASTQGMVQADYYDEQYDQFAQAKNFAQEVLAQHNSAQYEKAIRELTQTRDNLVNIKALKEVTNVAFDKAIYTADSRDAYLEVLEQAKEMLVKVNSQKNVDDMVKKVQDTYNKLIKKGNTTLIESELKRLSLLNEKFYYKTAWDNLQKLVKEATNSMKNENITEAEVTAIVRALQTARFELVELESLQTQVNSKEDASLYTKESYEVYEKAFAHALAILMNETSSQQEVDKAHSDLNAAQKNLVKVAGNTTIVDKPLTSVDTSDATNVNYLVGGLLLSMVAGVGVSKKRKSNKR